MGRSVDWHERAKAHRGFAKRGGTEAKYQHIRKLWAAGKDFELVVLDQEPKARYEKWYHWLLGMEYDLTNQKMGDAWATEQEVGRELRKRGERFTTPDAFLSALDRGIAEAKARAEAAKTQAKIRGEKEMKYSETTRFAGDFGKEKISDGMQELLSKRNHGKRYR